jgi:hypothetical protein
MIWGVGSWLAVLGALAVTAAHAGSGLDAIVISITDGDTLWAELAQPGPGLAAREKVRLVGIDCPEKNHGPWGARASARLSALVLGTSVQIEVALQTPTPSPWRAHYSRPLSIKTVRIQDASGRAAVLLHEHDRECAFLVQAQQHRAQRLENALTSAT